MYGSQTSGPPQEIGRLRLLGFALVLFFNSSTEPTTRHAHSKIILIFVSEIALYQGRVCKYIGRVSGSVIHIHIPHPLREPTRLNGATSTESTYLSTRISPSVQTLPRTALVLPGHKIIVHPSGSIDIWSEPLFRSAPVLITLKPWSIPESEYILWVWVLTRDTTSDEVPVPGSIPVVVHRMHLDCVSLAISSLQLDRWYRLQQ